MNSTNLETVYSTNLEPVYSTAVDERRELPHAVPERVANRRERDNYVQVATATVHEEVVEREGREFGVFVARGDDGRRPHALHQLGFLVRRKQIRHLNQDKEATEITAALNDRYKCILRIRPQQVATWVVSLKVSGLIVIIVIFFFLREGIFLREGRVYLDKNLAQKFE